MKTLALRLAPVTACFIVALLTIATPAAADQILGTWLSPPDGKKQTGHVEVRQCGGGYCGILVRTYDKHGAPIITKNTGKTVFWDLVEVSPETYRKGRVYVPILNITAKATIEVVGNLLKIRGCAGLICKKQTWTRVN